jgi:hypothetical protein
MTSFLVRNSRSFAEKFISPPSCIGRCLFHKSNRYPTVGDNIAPIFTRAFTTSSLGHPGPSSQKNRNWAYLAASIFTGVCLQQAYMCLKKKASNEEDANFEGLPKPVSSISSGTYKAAYYNPIPPTVVQKMMGKSYKENCPIPITDLAYVRVTYYDMKGQVCLGELVVHKKIADMTMEIFKDIHAAKFPIEKMRLIDEYEADDDRSMGDNNSSAFCFRSITNRPGVISNHGLGIAIDINTHLNPYVKGDNIAPSNARKYADRSLNEPGMIHPDDVVVIAFKKRGFTWGGDWKSLKDYQHFEIDRKTLGITV